MSEPISIVKSYRDGHIGVRVEASVSGYGGSGSINTKMRLDLTPSQARDLAQALIRAADEEDSKQAKKAAAEERRRKWRDREIAAGRMRMVSAQEFFGRPQR